MLKVKVLRKFKNKNSDTVYNVGDIAQFSKNRVEEINSTKHGKLVEVIEEKKTKTEEVEVQDSNL